MLDPFVRYLCKVTPAPGEFWADLGFAYFEALYTAGIPTRVFAHGAADLGIGRWAPHGADFLRKVPAKPLYTNVVCVPPSAIGADLGVRNVAITIVPASGLTQTQAALLSVFDAVIATSEDQVVKFLRYKIKASIVPPAQFAAFAVAIR